MNANTGRIFNIAEGQHGAVAVWQLRKRGMTWSQITSGVRTLMKVHYGVYALGDLDELGWFMAGALALGPEAAVSHLSALMLLGLRPHETRDIDVSVPGRHGREPRDGITIHRPRRLMDVGTIHGIPVTSPTQSLIDADLQPHQLYRALEKAENRYHLDLPLNDVVRLKQAVRGTTRSDTEARFLLLCHEHGFELPLVNHVLNGCETDFHWPEKRLVVEVDGFEHHRERPQFNEDRFRGLRHRRAGFEVVRISADHVYDEPELVVDAMRAALAVTIR